MIKVAIVDDESLARRRIRDLLAGRDDIRIVAQSASGRHAVTEILRCKPDIVFLDVEMPEMNGFEVIECLGVEHSPVIVFVTAYDHYAVRAFKVHAVDYLLKPFDKDRFEDALCRAIREVSLRGTAPVSDRILPLLERLRLDKKVSPRILVKSGGRVTILESDSIDWIESAGNYVRLHAGKQSHMIRETMGSIQKRLDPRLFVRIHRTALVNVDRIREILPHFQGNAVVVLNSGQKLPLSRSSRDALDNALRAL